MSKVNGAVIFLVACALAMLALRGAVVYAQEEELDHFKGYRADPDPGWDDPFVLLNDQFGLLEGFVDPPFLFSPPVAKTPPGGESPPIIHPEDHLT